MPSNWWNAVCPSGGERSNGKPKKLGRGMLAKPFGPPVTSYQLSRTMRMISPKPSVTIAR